MAVALPMITPFQKEDLSEVVAFSVEKSILDQERISTRETLISLQYLRERGKQWGLSEASQKMLATISQKLKDLNQELASNTKDFEMALLAEKYDHCITPLKKDSSDATALKIKSSMTAVGATALKIKSGMVAGAPPLKLLHAGLVLKTASPGLLIGSLATIGALTTVGGLGYLAYKLWMWRYPSKEPASSDDEQIEELKAELAKAQQKNAELEKQIVQISELPPKMKEKAEEIKGLGEDINKAAQDNALKFEQVIIKKDRQIEKLVEGTRVLAKFALEMFEKKKTKDQERAFIRECKRILNNRNQSENSKAQI
jgi:hypothetical protein